MKKITNSIKSSASNFKNLRCLTATALLVALAVLLEVYSPINTEQIKINLSFIPIALAGWLFGPAVAMVAAIPADLIGAVLSGSAPLPLYSLVAVFEAAVYGFLLYKTQGKKLTVRLIISQVIVVCASHIVFNTALGFFYGFISRGKAREWFIARIVKNLVELPIDLILLTILFPAISSAYKRSKPFSSAKSGIEPDKVKTND